MVAQPWHNAWDRGDCESRASVEESFLREALGMSYEQAQVSHPVTLRMVEYFHHRWYR